MEFILVFLSYSKMRLQLVLSIVILAVLTVGVSSKNSFKEAIHQKMKSAKVSVEPREIDEVYFFQPRDHFDPINEVYFMQVRIFKHICNELYDNIFFLMT